MATRESILERFETCPAMPTRELILERFESCPASPRISSRDLLSQNVFAEDECHAGVGYRAGGGLAAVAPAAFAVYASFSRGVLPARRGPF